jgi:hypothetical protein
VLGGYCDENDFTNSTLDLRNTFFRESSEELGDLNLYNEEILALGKIGDDLTVLGCARTDFSSEEIIQIRRKNEGKLPDLYESDNMVFVDNTPNEVGDFLSKNKDDMSQAARFNVKYYIKSKFNNYDYMTVE